MHPYSLNLGILWIGYLKLITQSEIKVILHSALIQKGELPTNTQLHMTTGYCFNILDRLSAKV